MNRDSRKEFGQEEVRRGEDLRGGGGGRSNKEEVVKSLIASAIGPCTGIRCAAGDEALALDLRG